MTKGYTSVETFAEGSENKMRRRQEESQNAFTLAETYNRGQEGTRSGGQAVESYVNLGNVTARAAESLIAIRYGERILQKSDSQMSGNCSSRTGLLRQKPLNDTKLTNKGGQSSIKRCFCDYFEKCVPTARTCSRKF